MNTATKLQTPLINNEDLSHVFNCQNLRIKDESKNTYGTYKDRRSKYIVEKALHDKVDKLVLITSGNAGYSLGKFCEGTGIKVVCIVDQSLSSKVILKLKSTVYKVIPANLSKRILKPEEVISLARENETEVIWEVTNGYSVAYEEIINEIASSNPSYIICPVGSGEAFTGLYDAVKKRRLSSKLIGVRPLSNPSFADKLFTLWTPYASKLKMMAEQGHMLLQISEENIHQMYERAKNHIACEPSSAIAFAALDKIDRKNNIIILVNSGKGLA